MQLDLFLHSQTVMLRNDLIQAVRERRWADGRAVAAKLAEFPQEALLAPGLRLLDEIDHWKTRARAFSSHQEAREAIQQAESMLADAVTLLGAAQADDWMRPVWQDLADACGKLAYQRDHPEMHSAAFLIRGGDWEAAETAIARIPAWRRIPEPLAWMAEVRLHLKGLDFAWPLLAELAWRAPARFAALSGHLDAPVLTRLVRAFSCDLAADDADFAWFPAWALIAEPRLADVLCLERTPEYSPPEQAAWTVRRLLNLERQGRHQDVIEQRKTLRALHPDLFAQYMHTRA
jgi:hypothetical protein